MSLTSWKEEFYPVEAEAGAIEAPEGALAHALRKWQGLVPENLVRHGVRRKTRFLTDATGGLFYIDGSTCALCYLYAYSKPDPRRDPCSRCPLTLVRKGKPCDQGISPYHHFLISGNPGPMIALIEAAIAAQGEK